MKKTEDLSEGSLFSGILVFSIPLIFTNLLQILFNMTDSAVAGRFAGSIALGCVGSTTQLVFFCTGLLTGLGGGINVLTAFYIGKKSEKDLADNIYTSAVISLIFGILILAVGFIFAPVFLNLIKTREELFDGALLYFRIYMLAMPATALYNFGNAVLSAHGNTKLPLLFLLLAGIVNVILDLVLVIVFKMGVAGVGIATVVSQYISCILTLASIFKGIGNFRFSIKNIRVSSHKAAQVVKIGIPSGLQNCIFALANLFIQA